MSGHINGVQAKFKLLQPGSIYTHCVAHKLELAVLDAINRGDNYLKEFDDLMNDLLKFYFYSPQCRKELKEIGELLQGDFKQMGLLKNIRWVASRSRALHILETNFKAMVFDLESKTYGNNETAKKATGYLNGIKKPDFVFYLHFLQDFVDSVKELSLIFQSDKLLICEVPRLIEEKVANLEMLSVMSDSINRLVANISVDDGEINYKEVALLKATERRATTTEHSVEAYNTLFCKKFENIIEKTQDHLRFRFNSFKKVPLCHLVTLFDFKQWPKIFTGDNKRWGFDCLESAASFYFDHHISETEMELCKREWPVFRMRVSRLRTNCLYDVYTDLLKEKDYKKYPCASGNNVHIQREHSGL